MSRRTRIFLGVLAVYVAAVASLLYRVSADLDSRYRESAEESLVDTANLLATLLERQVYSGVIQTDELERTLDQLTQRPLDAQIYSVQKSAVVLRVYVTDRNGIVLFDSSERDVGTDYRGWRDVARTLAGQYGARTTLTDAGDPRSAVMYVAAPIRERSASGVYQLVGVISVGKPIAAFSPFIANARDKLVAVGVIAVAAFMVLLLIVTVWLVRPFGLVSDLWRASRSSQAHGIERLWQPFRTAFANLRDALAGKSYVDEYVATLTHEIKSPLAAIRGAAELLREPLPEDARARFARNIEEQVARAQDLVDRMLELSGLERRGVLERVEPVSLAQLADAVRAELAPIAERRGVEIYIDVGPALTVEGDHFLLQRALSNLVLNAIDFSPPETAVIIDAIDIRSRVEVTVRDRGAGLPDFARDKVFKKFFSLPRPDSGRKGTGLGLAFVREVATLHGGAARLANHPEGGALATFSLPRPTTR